MSEENQSGLRNLLFGDDERSDVLDKVLAYVAHRLKDGAHLGDVLEEEYVVRNTTQTQRDEILTDPRLAQESREGLGQDLESDELKPEYRTKGGEEPKVRRSPTARGIHAGGTRPGSRTAVHGGVGRSLAHPLVTKGWSPLR